jgi:hypothetical protein
MNLHQCQAWAETNGFDSAEFYADFPAGKMKCKWLDAYYGMFSIPNVIDDGFLMVKDIDKEYPDLVCEPIKKEKEAMEFKVVNVKTKEVLPYYTDWFPSEIKPVHRGVYEVFDEGSYAYWSGKLWGWTMLSVASAAACKPLFGAASQHKPWRGLTKKAAI